MTDYLIFARKEYQQPLEYIGTLPVETETLRADLDRRAQAQFGVEAWVEMVAVPLASVVHVIPMEPARV